MPWVFGEIQEGIMAAKKQAREKETEKSSENKKQEELQKKYLELQLLAQKINEIQKQVQNIDAQITDLLATSESLSELSKTKAGSEMFVPISPGVFAKAELKDSRELLVNVGAGTAVKKSLPEVRKMIDGQAAEIENYKQQAMEQLERLIGHARKIEKELKGLV